MDVAVYGTQAEAIADGARIARGRLTTPQGRRVVTPHSVAPLDGLRVSSYVATPTAMSHRNWDRIRQTLDRSIVKSKT